MMLSNIIMSCSHVPINIQQIAVSLEIQIVMVRLRLYTLHSVPYIFTGHLSVRTSSLNNRLCKIYQEVNHNGQ